MKKVLFGTTALVAATVAGSAYAAEGLSYGVSGYARAGVEFPSRDGQQIHVLKDMEVHFGGSTTLDNGLTVGGRMEIEMQATGGDQIDEQFVYVSGSFGRVELGGEDSAPYNMRVWTPGSYIGHGADDPTFDFVGGYVGTSSYLTSDANKITYKSPVMSGFQIGVSYTPEGGVDGGNNEQVGGDADNDNTAADNENLIQDVVQVGVAYNGSFGGVDIGLSGEYGSGTRTMDSNPAVGTIVQFSEDQSEWGAGISLGFSGFTVTGTYLDADDTQGFTAYAIGASYGTGPWTIGAGYAKSEATGGGEVKKVSVGANYSLGAGATVGAGLDYGDNGTNTETSVGVMLGLSF